MELRDIEATISSGVAARMCGRGKEDNPYLSVSEMPTSKRRTIEDWRTLHDAWILGWYVQGALKA